MILITHPSDGRKRPRCGLGRRLAAMSLALIWTAALSFAASSLWAGAPSVLNGGRDNPALNLELNGKVSGPAEVHLERDGA